MSWNQVKLANQSKLLTIGGHSHTHVILSFLNQKELKHELDVSINMLHDKAGVSPTHYSYPEGLANCYNKEVINELKTRGVKCCPTAIFGVNNEKTSSFELKRIMI
ncbi:MAG: polysaccharide deacetylase family protein [Flavobacteriaceae bacterium]|jgi:peptidoglycan/xylan/chitin deacetylase (PgdA/CDA1 family)|nr:polysaccharide deacetylase family protein [Flavobacteriaceae bacterium]MBT6353360.1 polysaccharide deacetylase family protein [Pelagibacteraceae bacterium]MBT7623940.1 polysaccharide deacetylase family protein [Flavobacteriaceae bacterium]